MLLQWLRRVKIEMKFLYIYEKNETPEHTHYTQKYLMIHTYMPYEYKICRESKIYPKSFVISLLFLIAKRVCVCVYVYTMRILNM